MLIYFTALRHAQQVALGIHISAASSLTASVWERESLDLASDIPVAESCCVSTLDHARLLTSAWPQQHQ